MTVAIPVKTPPYAVGDTVSIQRDTTGVASIVVELADVMNLPQADLSMLFKDVRLAGNVLTFVRYDDTVVRLVLPSGGMSMVSDGVVDDISFSRATKTLTLMRTQGADLTVIINPNAYVGNYSSTFAYQTGDVVWHGGAYWIAGRSGTIALSPDNSRPGDFRRVAQREPVSWARDGSTDTISKPVSYTHLTLPTIYSV